MIKLIMLIIHGLGQHVDAGHAKALHSPSRDIPCGIRSPQKVTHKLGKALLSYGLPDAPREALHVGNVVVGHQV